MLHVSPKHMHAGAFKNFNEIDVPDILRDPFLILIA